MKWADAVVANLNGRVPDEGTVSEVALAWRSNKAVVLYKNDGRSLIDGADNPLVMGLGSFEVVRSISDLPGAVETGLLRNAEDNVEACLRAGALIAQQQATSESPPEFARWLIENHPE